MPEAGRRKQHRPFRVLEALQQNRARRRSLQQQRKPDARSHAFKKIVHLRVAGEQAERPPSAEFQQLHDFVRGLGREPRVTHVRHLPGQVQQRLIRKIELRRQRAVLRVVNAQPLSDVVEAPAHRQRRGSQYDRVELFEQPLPQNLADVDRRRRQEHAFVPPLVPVNEVFLVRFEQKRKLLP